MGSLQRILRGEWWYNTASLQGHHGICTPRAISLSSHFSSRPCSQVLNLTSIFQKFSFSTAVSFPAFRDGTLFPTCSIFRCSSLDGAGNCQTGVPADRSNSFFFRGFFFVVLPSSPGRSCRRR